MLGIAAGDLSSAPGLIRMNTIVLPRARAFSFALVFLMVLVHNQVVFGSIDSSRMLPFGLFLATWALGSWWLLVRYFETTPIHLGDVFVWAELPIFGLIVWASGAGESLIWPIFVIRIADQMWISRRRAVWATLGGMASLAVAFWAGGLTGFELNWGIEGFKIFAVGAVGAVLAAVATAPWEVRERTLRARELILELEERSEALELERLAAAQANQAKSDFLNRVSAELRAPMNAVVGFTNLLIRSRGLIGADGEHLERIRQNALHLLALINDVIDLSRIEDGNLTVQSEPVDLGALVQETVFQLENRSAGSRVMLQMVIPRGLRPITADEARLRQVLINLVGNALKFTEEGHVDVQLEADPKGRPTALHVRDTGPGLDRDILEGLFDPFEHLGNHDVPVGTGFGLAVSRSLCRLMGFHLTVRTRLGVGSTFSIHFGELQSQIDVPDPADRAGQGRLDSTPGGRDVATDLGPAWNADAITDPLRDE